MFATRVAKEGSQGRAREKGTFTLEKQEGNHAWVHEKNVGASCELSVEVSTGMRTRAIQNWCFTLRDH